MAEENKNSEALAILSAPAPAPATAEDTASMATVETAAAVPSGSSGGGNLLYKPMFSVRTEKFIYVTCVLLSLGAIVVSVIAGDLNWPRVVGDTCGVMGGLVGSLASAFGVSYTTMRTV